MCKSREDHVMASHIPTQITLQLSGCFLAAHILLTDASGVPTTSLWLWFQLQQAAPTCTVSFPDFLLSGSRPFPMYSSFLSLNAMKQPQAVLGHKHSPGQPSTKTGLNPATSVLQPDSESHSCKFCKVLRVLSHASLQQQAMKHLQLFLPPCLNASQSSFGFLTTTSQKTSRT